MNLDHRGARGAEPETGDGAGILVQLPHAFLLRECTVAGHHPARARRLRGRAVLLPAGTRSATRPSSWCCGASSTSWAWTLLGWREVPTDNSTLGATAVSGEPVDAADDRPPARQLPHPGRVRAAAHGRPQVRDAHGARVGQERRGLLHLLALVAHASSTRACSRPAQVPAYFPDLADEAFESALALIHSRFSTNTLPTWPLAHPFRTLAHNGEINTVRGNVNWMRSREAILESDALHRGRDPQDAAHRAGGQLRLGHPRQRRRAAHAGRPQPART